jgi:hypothetical protein
MTRIIAGLFESHRVADLAVEHLVQEYGVPRECVRVHGQDASGAGEARSPQDDDQAASLSDLGLPEDKLRVYADSIDRGQVVVAAQVAEGRLERVLSAYRDYRAEELEICEGEWQKNRTLA